MKIAGRTISFELIYLIVWGLAIVFVNPIGEFPINDDWAYSRNVYDLSVKGKFSVDSWPAMTLISQTMYGCLIAKTFGFSFTILRASILVLSILSGIIFYRTLNKLNGNNQLISFVFTCALSFSSVYFPLAFTFMTDNFFLAMVIFAIWFYVKYLETSKIISYLIFVLFCVLATLNRQHGLFLTLLPIGLFIKDSKFNFKKYFLIVLPGIICIGVHLGFLLLLKQWNISHNMQSPGKLAAYVFNASMEDFHIHIGDFLLVFGWLILPVSLVLIFNLRFGIYHSVLLSLSLIICYFLVQADWVYYPQGNISRFLEIGPRVVKQNTISPAYHLQYPMAVFLVKIIAFISLSIGIFFFNRRFNNQNVSTQFYFTLILPLTLIAVMYFIFIILNEAWFDRYVLPFAAMLILILNPRQYQWNKWKKAIALTIIFLIYTTSLIETGDHFKWQKTRWKALTDLHYEGISPNDIDGGFEYNGWYKPGIGFTDDDRSWWWVNRETYVISNEELKGFNRYKTYTIQRLLPYQKDTIFVLKKKGL